MALRRARAAPPVTGGDTIISPSAARNPMKVLCLGDGDREELTQKLFKIRWTDPDYIAGDPRVVSEIAAPMVLDGVLLGVRTSNPRRSIRSTGSTATWWPPWRARSPRRWPWRATARPWPDLAVRDGLTGLHNRRYFDDAVGRLLASREAMPESERRPVAAILFDLDHFGTFNKLHGVQVGDQALRVFAHAMRERLHQTDLVARFGGEEFVVVMDGSDRDHAVEVAEEIRIRLSSRTIAAEDGAPLRLSVSAGCAALDNAEPTAEALLRTADVALSMAKRGGRDRVVAAYALFRAQALCRAHALPSPRVPAPPPPRPSTAPGMRVAHVSANGPWRRAWWQPEWQRRWPDDALGASSGTFEPS